MSAMPNNTTLGLIEAFDRHGSLLAHPEDRRVGILVDKL